MKLHKKTISQILNTPEFPIKLMIYFAVQCAKDAVSKHDPNEMKEALHAIDLAERYSNGELIEYRQLNAVANASSAASNAASSSAASYASNAASNAAYAAAAASYASNAASNAAYAASSASYASNAASNAAYAAAAASYGTDDEYYKPLLFNIINDRLTRLEKLLIFGQENV